MTKNYKSRIDELISKMTVKEKIGQLNMVIAPTTEEEFEKMKDIYYTLCEKYNVKLNPVGHVFENILKENPDIRLHWFDGAHAGPYGSYANALCTYKTVFGDSIENASDESYDMYPVDGDTALCDRDRLLVKLDSKKALTIRKTVEEL